MLFLEHHLIQAILKVSNMESEAVPASWEKPNNSQEVILVHYLNIFSTHENVTLFHELLLW